MYKIHHPISIFFRDPLFFDGHSTLVERGHMQSMFESLTVQPVVVNAWAKVIMLKWTHNVRTDRVCLPVAIKVCHFFYLFRLF